MVGEFPELQGTMGRYYALHDGESPAVADAIAQHYWPRFAGGRFAAGSGCATAVALADKIEALVGMFGIGSVPTGDKDPFGLRRAALGVLRILHRGQQAVASLTDLIAAGFAAFAGTGAIQDARDDVLDVHLRATARLSARTGIHVRTRSNPSSACGRCASTRSPAHMLARPNIHGACPRPKRSPAPTNGSPTSCRKSGTEAAVAVDRALLDGGAEHELYTAVQTLLPVVHGHVGRGDYTAALRSLASARAPVDRFFDDVMVMADDRAVRANRLALLRGLAEAMNQVADLSKLAV